MAKPLGLQIASNIRVLRSARKMTQAQLAEAAQLSTDAVGRIERGTRSATIDTLSRLASALNVTVADLVRSDVKTPDFEDQLNRIVDLLRSEATPHQLTIIHGALKGALSDDQKG